MGRLEQAQAERSGVELKGEINFPALMEKIGLPTMDEPPKPEAEEQAKIEAEAKAKEEAEKKEKEGAEADALLKEKADAEAATKAEEEKKAQEAEKFIIPDEIRAMVGENVKTPTDLLVHVKRTNAELTELRQADKELSELFDADPALRAILADVLDYKESGGEKGRPLYDAMRVHLEVPEGEKVPDPSEDEAGYRAHIEKQLARQAKQKQAQEAERRAAAIRESAAEHAMVIRQTFQKSRNLSDKQMTDFQEKLDVLLRGDPNTGKLPENIYDVLWNAVYHKEEKSAAEKAAADRAAKEAREKAAEAEKKRRVGDGLPKFDGGKGPIDAPSALKSREELQPLMSAAFSSRRLRPGIPIQRS